MAVRPSSSKRASQLDERKEREPLASAIGVDPAEGVDVQVW
jgi:hypothetical protein